jgi:hypothetical protein
VSDPKADELIGETLLQLWDYFVASGWKAVFKMSLYIMKINEARLLAMAFEDIHLVLKEDPKAMLNGDAAHLNALEAQLFEEEVKEGEVPRTLYMRFKDVVDKDEDGADTHLTYLIGKFKQEFDSSAQLSEARAKLV